MKPQISSSLFAPYRSLCSLPIVLSALYLSFSFLFFPVFHLSYESSAVLSRFSLRTHTTNLLNRENAMKNATKNRHFGQDIVETYGQENQFTSFSLFDSFFFVFAKSTTWTIHRLVTALKCLELR